MVQLLVDSEMGPLFLSTKDHEKGVKNRTPMPFVRACKHIEGEVQEPLSEN